ncbi:MAG: hypothetical protein QCI38_06195, partial [Candidatus Thermoplasmatota archaeon]|nr:hypothetical protein [Candidatus Thermoplasmatota archaeon]
MTGEKNLEEMPSPEAVSPDVESQHNAGEPAPPMHDAVSPLPEQKDESVAQQPFRAMFSWEAYGRVLPRPPQTGRKKLVPIILAIMMLLIIGIALGL